MKAPYDTFCDRCEGIICIGEQTVMVETEIIPERFCIGCAMEALPSFVPEADDADNT
jgi:hypothetical protein